MALLSRIKHSAAVVADVLAEAGMLEDDREPVIVRWYANVTSTLPATMRAELDVLAQCDAYRLHLAAATTPAGRRHHQDPAVLEYAALKAWIARGHDSLREIGRDNVLAILPTDRLGHYTTLQGLRSLVGILKGRKTAFVNPTRRIDNPQPELRSPVAVDLEVLRSDLDSDRPATAALAALLAFHAIPIVHIRQLRLADVRDGRVRVGSQLIPLAEPARRRLTAYLDHRQENWPESINPYLFTHARSWWLNQAVSPRWIRDQLSLPAQSIRFDRILDEAHATGGDIRRLMDLFGISVETAYRYVKTDNNAAGAPVQ